MIFLIAIFIISLRTPTSQICQQVSSVILVLIVLSMQDHC